MADPIKITMLGDTGSGKTCYLVGMFAYLQLGLGALTLSAENLDDALRLNSLWDRLTGVEGEDRWPPPNDKANTQEYRFSLNYALRPVMQFEWLDYRGGALVDYPNVEDTAKLQQALAASSCVFMCVPGTYLRQTLTASRAREARIQMMLQHLTAAANSLGNNGHALPAVAIVVTMHDLCCERNEDDILADLRERFEPLFVPGSEWRVLVTKVSLGDQLADNPDAGEIEPYNLEVPVVFAIWAKLLDDVRELEERHQRYRAAVDSRPSTGVRGFFDRLFNSDEIASSLMLRDRSAADRDRLRTQLYQLAEKLESRDIFFGGERFKFRA